MVLAELPCQEQRQEQCCHHEGLRRLISRHLHLHHRNNNNNNSGGIESSKHFKHCFTNKKLFGQSTCTQTHTHTTKSKLNSQLCIQ